MALSLFERWSPESALNNTFEDMRESGLDGLKKHLTSNALKTVQSFESISSRPEIALFTTALMGGNAVSFLLEKLSECEWTIRDVMKGSGTSKAIVGFNYQGHDGGHHRTDDDQRRQNLENRQSDHAEV